ncbi:glycosyltransferase family 2 protein [Teredinibacter waterburyi]|jgi:Predicted glycosyltransferases|uniref:glycosyltransferase family 2 protein n=1 Tax=Teredinibacter waterburyi TaxID=1500538 RepID=UPI00165FA7FF|nr:glycosyltransferase family 2 protein [Teredinibacter waterburyi]
MTSTSERQPLELLIVIINYKTADLIIDCLKTVLPQLEANQKVVIVDNASGDGSSEIIQQWLAQNGDDKIDFIQSDENTGFSGGNNIGIQHCAADYYLLLNSDTLLRAGALQQMLAAAQQYPHAGLISPRLEWPDETPQISCFRYHNPVSELIGSASTGAITKLLSRWDVPLDIDPEPSFPEWTSFACVMVRRSVIDDVGLMDDDYFLYYEDVDYCRSVRAAGWSIVNIPSARVVHLRGGSSPVKKNSTLRKRLPSYVYESRTRYFAKHYGIAGFIFTNLLWHIGNLIAILRKWGGKDDFPTSAKAPIDIWKNLSSPLKSYRKN